MNVFVQDECDVYFEKYPRIKFEHLSDPSLKALKQWKF